MHLAHLKGTGCWRCGAVRSPEAGNSREGSVQSACIPEKLQAMGSHSKEGRDHWGRHSLARKQLSKGFKIKAVSFFVFEIGSYILPRLA